MAYSGTALPFTLLYPTLQEIRPFLVTVVLNICESLAVISRVGGVVVSVLATGPKDCGFKTRPRRWIFLRVIKIRSTPSSRMGNKAGRSHVVRFYGT
jgi:hypothetical protein